MIVDIYFLEQHDTNHQDYFKYIGFVDVGNYNIESVEAALELAYNHTQNIFGSWSQGPHFADGSQNSDYSPTIQITAPYPVYNGVELGHRSSMVGDKFVVNGVEYIVDDFGFKKVE